MCNAIYLQQFASSQVKPILPRTQIKVLVQKMPLSVEHPRAPKKSITKNLPPGNGMHPNIVPPSK